MNKISICYVVSSLCNEGPVNVMYNIIKYLDALHYSVTVLTLMREKDNSRINDFSRLPIKIIQINPLNKMSIWRTFYFARKKIIELRPDIIHVHCIRSRFLTLFITNEVKKVETLHNHPDLLKYKFGRFKGVVLRELSFIASKRCDLLIACSNSIRNPYIARGLNIISIVNGSSLTPIATSREEKIELRRKYGLNENKEWFVFVGRMAKEKRPEVAVKVFEELTNEDVGLLMLGDGGMYNELKNRASDSIVFVGYSSNVVNYLRCADYYISCSDTEGMPNALLESMAIGLPCVVSDIPAHHEVLDKSKRVIGRFFNNNDIMSVKNAIMSIRSYRTPETIEYIQQFYVNHFTAYTMSHKYQEEYTKLLKPISEC